MMAFVGIHDCESLYRVSSLMAGYIVLWYKAHSADGSAGAVDGRR